MRVCLPRSAAALLGIGLGVLSYRSCSRRPSCSSIAGGDDAMMPPRAASTGLPEDHQRFRVTAAVAGQRPGQGCGDPGSEAPTRGVAAAARRAAGPFDPADRAATTWTRFLGDPETFRQRWIAAPEVASDLSPRATGSRTAEPAVSLLAIEYIVDHHTRAERLWAVTDPAAKFGPPSPGAPAPRRRLRAARQLRRPRRRRTGSRDPALPRRPGATSASSRTLPTQKSSTHFPTPSRLRAAVRYE